MPEWSRWLPGNYRGAKSAQKLKQVRRVIEIYQKDVINEWQDWHIYPATVMGQKKKREKAGGCRFNFWFLYFGLNNKYGSVIEKKNPGDVRTPLYFKQTVCSSSVQTG